MKCRPQTIQPMPDVDLCKYRGVLPTQTHSYAVVVTKEASRDVLTVYILSLVILTCVSVFLSLPGGNCLMKRAHQNPVQSNSHPDTARLVIQPISATPLDFNNSLRFIDSIHRLLQGSFDCSSKS